MQGQHQFQPELFSQIDYEALIPTGHLLRKIDRVLDLRFLRGLTAPLYSVNKGRPSIDPEVFVRMVLLEYLYNINSDRQLCEEIGYNFAYRWFCHLSLRDKVPDHSSMTTIRDRLGEKTYEAIFKEIVEQCRRAGLVKGERIMADGSIIRANASIYNMVERETEPNSQSEGPAEENQAPSYSKDGLSNNDIRRRNILGKKISNQTHVSKSDPDSSLAGKEGQEKGLSYKAHHIIDADTRVILDPHVTTGSVSEVKVICDRVDHAEKTFGLDFKEAIADRGYGSAENLQSLADRGIDTNIPLWSTRTGQSLFKDIELGFKINLEEKLVICPAGHKMKYRGRDNTHCRNKFEMFPKICSECPSAGQCMTEKDRAAGKKTFFVSDFYKIWIEVHEKQKNPEFKTKLWERMWKMEGIFAEAKTHHGMRRARYRGRAKVQIQIYLTATVQNLKRLAGAASFIFRSILRDFIFPPSKTEFFKNFCAAF